jgi:hypothetical protein
MTAGRRDARPLHELPEAGLAQGAGTGAGPEKDSARSGAHLGVPYAGFRRGFRVCLRTAGRRESVDHFEDLFALGAGHAPHFDGHARQQKNAGNLQMEADGKEFKGVVLP